MSDRYGSANQDPAAGPPPWQGSERQAGPYGSYGYGWDAPWRAGRRSPASSGANLRCSDAERNAMADTLSRHYSDGRLDEGEFKERLERTMAAKTRGDLQGMLSDLPPLGNETAPPPQRHRGFWRVAALVALVVVTLSAAPFFVWHAPVLLLVLGGLWLWHRASWHDRRRHWARQDPNLR